uniref:Reverse transcriptase domain-containing protein n=1 Tax=Cajanus cajan TaxID=3821 RepID=A0A151T0K9_CAJCA|nr:hypothetical protein KK1_022993 [Cajanus cajan]
MLDLGASINVMPLSIFNSLSLGTLQPTGVVIQLANKSVAHPTDFVEDVLVRVGELIFPADFYVLDMEDRFSHGSVPIILGRPFFKTAQTKIDVYAGTLSMEFGDIVVHFNILDAMKFPSEAHSVFRAELIDDLVDEHIHGLDSSHAKKHSFSSDLNNYLPCIESETESESEYQSECEIDYEPSEFEFDTLGAVPLALDFIQSECTNHLQEVQKNLTCRLRYRLRNPFSLLWFLLMFS